MMKKIFHAISPRTLTQALFALLLNINLFGFITGTIYKGPLKQICVPGLNCYSCPGAIGACPIGSFQAVANGERRFSFYVVGSLMLFGLLLGRLICGLICPFGFLQDLLYKIKSKKLKISLKQDAPFRYIKYVVLVVMVVLLPMFYRNQYGMGLPFFCEFICPSGTFMGAIPLLITNEGLRQGVGFLFGWKMLILVAIIILSIFIYRSFCRYLCPLGAFYALFNKFTLYHYGFAAAKCTKCQQCTKACNMGLEPLKDVNHPECIRCGKCVSACKFGAITKPSLSRSKNSAREF